MYCIVVKRGDFEGYDILHKAFGQKAAVVWERRHGERRQVAHGLHKEEQRLGERRGPSPVSWTALGFVVVQREP